MTARCSTAPALRARLRTATQDDHQELDDALGRLDLADRHDYACFLRLQSRARIGVESWLARWCPQEWLPPAQTGLIESDLSALGCARADGFEENIPAFTYASQGPLAWLGAAWVLAGSSLGNRMMERELTSRAPEGWPMQFLRDETMPAYFKALRPLLASDEINPGAERTARAVFAHFSREADRRLVATAA
jgi:heme oxygenase|tara:strand:- start:10770 stop:11345 length:576 start_codon:yes stop_codon:yes gene_type:complete